MLSPFPVSITPLSLITFLALISLICPSSLPPALSTTLPFSASSPMLLTSPLLLPSRFPPMLTFRPFIIPFVLSRSPEMSTPASLVFPRLSAFRELSRLAMSSFVSPSDRMYPCLFTVLWVFSSILPSLLISPLLLSSLSPFTVTLSVALICPAFLVDLPLITTFPFASILPYMFTSSDSASNASSPSDFLRYPVITSASTSTSVFLAFTTTFSPAVTCFLILTFLGVLYTTLFVE